MNYGKKGTDRRSKEFSRSSYGKKRIAVLIAKIVMILFLLATAAVVCIGIFFVKGVINEAPEIDIMDATPSGYMSTVLDSEGEVTAELVSSGANRIYAKLDEIPADLQHAFVAIEDARFYEHHGIDVKGILRAGVKGLTSGNFSEGASTLTQQLLKTMYLTTGQAKAACSVWSERSRNSIWLWNWKSRSPKTGSWKII